MIKVKKIMQNEKFNKLFTNIIFLEFIYAWFIRNKKREIKATAAQFAFALTKTLSIKTINRIGIEKTSKKTVWKSNFVFFIK